MCTFVAWGPPLKKPVESVGMNIEPKEYDLVKSKGDQDKRLWQNVIDRLADAKEELCKSQLETIVDIGSGTGQLTAQIGNSIPGLKKIIGCDIDPQMVAFAKHNYRNKIVDFVVQDVSVDFENFKPKLSGLTDKVDAVVSHWALHWVPPERRDALLNNLKKLLKPEGIIFASVVLLKDLFVYLDESDEKKELSKIIKVPPVDKQVSQWKAAFEKAGFKNVRIENDVSETRGVTQCNPQ